MPSLPAFAAPLGLWLAATIFGVIISWLARLAIWDLFIKDNPELADAPQP